MKSQTFEQAEKVYNENKDALIKNIYEMFNSSIDYQEEWDQVAVWFSGIAGNFSLCYQNSDMNGESRGEANYDNPGADSGLDELKEILKNDERFQQLIAEEEYWKYEFLEKLISDFCVDFFEKNSIADYFEFPENEED